MDCCDRSSGDGFDAAVAADDSGEVLDRQEGVVGGLEDHGARRTGTHRVQEGLAKVGEEQHIGGIR